MGQPLSCTSHQYQQHFVKFLLDLAKKRCWKKKYWKRWNIYIRYWKKKYLEKEIILFRTSHQHQHIKNNICKVQITKNLLDWGTKAFSLDLVVTRVRACWHPHAFIQGILKSFVKWNVEVFFVFLIHLFLNMVVYFGEESLNDHAFY